MTSMIFADSQPPLRAEPAFGILAGAQALNRFPDQARVASLTGTSVGFRGEGHVRFSHATSTENSVDPIQRIRTIL
ncbi:hypothetical protein KQ247_01130 [Ruegeria pomeroyi]|nr:hypothetical protein [Ruegeria pomeroyi]NVK99001.1 hypothetical protein [Ruegeria pomeroyi]NVL03043.1 hypothetical protein [Ruegeria pomeroyi]QWV09263.1 hypothetical protein KQ247_01130 [Ruegeria pomeroyi]HCE71046.1 hypothetical protein [Ruegeria sp.]